MDFLFGKGEKTQQIQRFTPEQQSLLNTLVGKSATLLPQSFDYLSQLLSPTEEAIESYSAPAMRSFEESILPTIAERFTGMGAQKSSAFGQQLGKAGASLAENLAAQRASMQKNALSQLQGLLSGAMTPSFENVFRPGTKGLLGSGAESFMQLLPLLLSL